MAWNMSCNSFVVVISLLFGAHLVYGQLYFGSIGGLSGWFGKPSERYLKHITAAQCETEPCLPYSGWNEDFSGREFEETSSPNVEETVVENGRLIGLLDNVDRQRGSIKVHWVRTKTDIDCDPPVNKTTGKKPETNTETTGMGIMPVGHIPDKKVNVTDKRVNVTDIRVNVTDRNPNRTSTERRPSVPLVQVYVVASGTGGAHTNIGDGGFYGKNNGHAISTGKADNDARKDWNGGFGWEDNNRDVIPQRPIPPQTWTKSQNQHWSIDRGQSHSSKDIVEIEAPPESDFRLPLMEDKIGEASTKYGFNYHGINIKPESLATRTRRKLQNWHKGDLLNGYYRFWFRR